MGERGAVVSETHQEALSERMTPDRRLANGALGGVVLVAILLRLVPVLFVPSLNWGDEIFQATEQAHRLVYGSGLVPWEFQLGVRSWLLPGVIAGLMEAARLLGDGPDYYLPVIAAGFAALAAAPVICCFRWCERWFGLSGALVGGIVVAVAPELVYFGARTLTEIVAAHLLVIALYLFEPGHAAVSRRRLFIGGVLLGLTGVLRIHLAPALGLVALWTAARAPRARLPLIIAGAGIVAALSGLLDALTLGAPFASIWRYAFDNLYLGVSASFGVEPATYYLAGELGLWQGGLAALLLFSLLGARRMPLLLAAAAVILAVHSSIAHKEYRFIYPAILLVAVLAGVGLAQLAAWAAEWLGARRVRPSIARWAATALASFCWCALSWQVWTQPAFALLRHRAHDNLVAASFVAHTPAICGIGLYGLDGTDWVSYGGYTYFHRALPMFWPKDAAEFARLAPGFDTLLYTKPPPAAGFTTGRCFGEVCVARRPGGCTPLPMQPMPFPAPLAAAAAR